MKTKKIETKSDRQKVLRKTLVEVSLLLESPWLTEETRSYLLEKRKRLSQEAYQ